MSERGSVKTGCLVAEKRTLAELLVEVDRDRSPGSRPSWVREMATRLRKIDALHQPFGIYDECGHEHKGDEETEKADEPGVVYVAEVGFTCEEGRVQTVCRHCHTDDGEVREDTSDWEWPCATRRLLDGED